MQNIRENILTARAVRGLNCFLQEVEETMSPERV